MTRADRDVDAALRALAASLVNGVVAEAMEKSRAEAVEILRARLTAVLVEEAGAAVSDSAPRRPSTTTTAAAPAEAPRDLAVRRQPPATAAATAAGGCYVYGITRAAAAGALGVKTGVRGCPVEILTKGPLAAAVSPMPEDQLGWGLDAQHDVDIDTLAPLLRDHERVLEELLQLGPVLPSRFGVMYPDPAAVERVLTTHAETIGPALDHLEGKAEWGLTVSWDPAGPAGLDTVPQAPTGRGYLAQRQQARAAAAAQEEAGMEFAAALHEALLACAVDGVIHSARPADRQGAPVLLKASYLIADSQLDEFRRTAAARLADGPGDFGLRGDLTGPWPAYNFAGLELAA